MNGPPRSLPQRAREKLLWAPASLRLMRAAFLGRPVEMWIGDSHAMSSNRSIVSAAFMTGTDGVVIVRVGPRLMYSLATNGFPPWSTRLARIAGRMCRTGQILPIFMAGEIDVRVHLVEHGDRGFGFVQGYVTKCGEFARLLRADRYLVALPPPPCDVRGFRIWYPVVGSLEERLSVWRTLRAALTEASEASGADVLDFSPVVAGADGSLRPELSDDGAHTNLVAIPLIRAAVSRVASQTTQ